MLLGADVASYQPNIDWLTYARCGRSFVIIKANEGTSYLNPQFQAQLFGAQAAGLAVACYMFYAWDGTPLDEAAFFVNSVRRLTVLTGVPLLVDFERGGYNPPAPPQASEEAFHVLSMIRQLCGYNPLWYTSPSFASQYGLGPGLDGFGLWLANYQSAIPAPIPPAPFWAIWQHASDQSIPGIPELADSDLFNGDLAQFRAYGGS